MTRLVLALLLVAPCASMKMKAASPDDLEYPNCQRIAYNQLGQYDYQKTCRVYHSFMGYHPETGQQQYAPELYGFADTEFILDGVSEELLWKVRADSSWGSGFAFETTDGSTLDERGVNCDKRSSTGGVIPGFLDTCPHGALWQAERQYNETVEVLKDIKEEIKHTKKEIDRTRKVMKIMAKGSIPDLKGNLTSTQEALTQIKKLVKDAKEQKKNGA